MHSFRVDNVAVGGGEHLLARILHFFDSTIEEFKQFALERYDNVLFPVLSIDLLEISLVSCRWSRLLNVWILAAEEVLEDLEVVASVHVACELVVALRHTVL